MNTTPGTEDNSPPAAGAGHDYADRLEALASLDPADAPVDAEALAADLAGELEGVVSDGSPPAGSVQPADNDEDLP